MMAGWCDEKLWRGPFDGGLGLGLASVFRRAEELHYTLLVDGWGMGVTLCCV